MSSLIVHTDETQVLLLTDTLAVVNGKPYKYTTKAHAIPHLNLIVVGTGVGAFADWWSLYINTELNVLGIDALDVLTATSLPTLWIQFRNQRNIADTRTTTIYHFGLSESTNTIKTFIYRSEEGFRSEQKGHGIMVKPSISIPAKYDLPRDAKAIMDKQRKGQVSVRKVDRVYIGGEIQVHHLTKNGFQIYTQDRFEDFDTDHLKMKKDRHL